MAAICDESVLQMYAEGILSVAEQGLVEAHLAGCPACRQNLLRYKGLLWDLQEPTPAPIPAELAAVSDGLMAAWDEAQRAAEAPVAEGWLAHALLWTRTTPGVAPALDGVGQGAGAAGRALTRAGAAGLKWLWRRGGGHR